MPTSFCCCWNKCFSIISTGLVAKTCATAATCREPLKCCDKDLCNGAIPTGSSILLLLVSSAITSVFLWGSGDHLMMFLPDLYNSKCKRCEWFQNCSIKTQYDGPLSCLILQVLHSHHYLQQKKKLCCESIIRKDIKFYNHDQIYIS